MPNSFKTDLKNNNIKTTKLILSHIFSGDSLEKIMLKQGDGAELRWEHLLYL